MLLCVDLDGVLYRGSEPIPGVGALLTERVAAGDRVAYITNNKADDNELILLEVGEFLRAR